jgi:hypothetical protein
LTGKDLAVKTAAERDDVAPLERYRRVLRKGPAAGLCLAALLVLHAAVQLASRPYPRWGDAILSFDYARDFPDVPADHHAARLGVILPGRLFVEIFGFGQVGYYAYPVIMGVVLVVATFSVGRRLFGLTAGTVAGFLIVFNPVLVRSVGNTTSWHLLPDVPAAGWFTAGLALLLGVVYGADGTPRPTSRLAVARLVGAGLCFGIAYTCREFTAFMFVLIPLVAVLYRFPWRRLVPVVLSMAAVLAAELLVSWTVWGDPLTRFRIASSHGLVIEPVSRVDTLLKFPHALYNQPRGSISILMLALTLGGAAVFAKRNLIFAAAWLLSLFVPLLLLGGFADPGYMSLRLQLTRYWVPILPALVIGAVGTVRHICLLAAAHPSASGRWLGWRLAAFGLVFLMWYPLPMLRYAVGNPNDRSWNELRAYLEAHDDELGTISSDYRSAQMLEMYSRAPVGGDRVWHGDVNVFADLNERGFYDKLDDVPAPEDLPQGALLFTSNTAAHRPQSTEGWLPAFRAGGIRLYVPDDTSLESLARVNR